MCEAKPGRDGVLAVELGRERGDAGGENTIGFVLGFAAAEAEGAQSS
jgi:hypothetical protein